MSFIRSLETKSLLPQSLDFIYHRVTRGNVFPLFVVLVLIIAVKIIRLFWKVLPFYWIGKAIHWVLRKLLKTSRENKIRVHKTKGFLHSYELLQRGDPLRTEAAPYSGAYYRYLPPTPETPVMTALLSRLPTSVSWICCVGQEDVDSEVAVHKRALQVRWK